MGEEEVKKTDEDQEKPDDQNAKKDLAEAQKHVVATSIIESLKTGVLDKKDLKREVRLELVDYLTRNQDLTEHEMAELLGVSRPTIWADKCALRETNFQTFGVIENQSYMKRIVTEAQILKERARKAGDIRLEWKIEKELSEILGRMGLIRWDKEFSPNFFLGDHNETNITNNVTVQSEKIQIARVILNGADHKQKASILRSWRIANRARTRQA